MKCDTAASTNFDECNRCFREWLTDEYDASLLPCLMCGVRHLLHNMSEKLEGHYCESCAAAYETNLLDKMTRKEAL